MFRRKDESTGEFAMETNDYSPASDAQQPSLASSAPQAAASSSQPSAPATASAQPPAAQSPYAPVTAPARPSTDSARSSAPVSNYRPAPMAELSRSVGARSSAPAGADAPRSAPAPISERLVSGKSNRRVLTVGNDILLKGEIATCDRLVIEGRVEAKLSEVHTVEIAECGSFKGTAEVEDAEISGVFEGDLVVRNRIVIYATGEVRGNISYGEIEIERGGRLTGQIKTVTQTATAGKSKALDVLQDAAKIRSPKEAASPAAA